MITNFKGKTAVLTGAGSGFGLECARIGAALGMNLVLADVQQDALDAATAEMRALGAPVLAVKLDVAKAAEVEALGAAVMARFGAPPFRLQQRRCGCRWPDLGAHAGRLGMGGRGQFDGCCPRCSGIYSNDAGCGQKRPDVSRSYR